MSYETIFDESYERVVHVPPEDGDFFESFYQHFLASCPVVRRHFANTDMTKQRKMLKKSFYSLLTFYATSATDAVLEKIAASHSRKGLNIEPYLYDLWLESLITTVREYDAQFDDEIELAWRLVLSSGITYMKFHYDH